MEIVAAGVHTAVLRGKWQPRFLSHGQRVHIAAQQQRFPTAAAHGAGNACTAHRLRFIAEFFQLFQHKGSGLGQIKAQLRALMQIAAVTHQLIFQFQHPRIRFMFH